MYPWVLLISLGLDEWQNTIPSMLSVYISELVFSAEKNDKQHNCRIRNICDYDAGRPYNLLQSQWRMVSVLSFLRSHHNLEKRGDEKCREGQGRRHVHSSLAVAGADCLPPTVWQQGGIASGVMKNCPDGVLCIEFCFALPPNLVHNRTLGNGDKNSCKGGC
jgi:hypothetical protein